MEPKAQICFIVTFVLYGFLLGFLLSQMFLGQAMTWLTLVVMLAFWLGATVINFHPPRKS